jgi:CheY-like chemotaxis protein
MMGGKISVVSDGHSGSAFTLNIKNNPLNTKQDSNIEIHLAPLKARRLLVVDPSSSVQQAIANFLYHSDIEIQRAMNAQEAVTVLKQAHAQQQYFDYVLIDLGLCGIDGIELSKAIYDSKYSGNPFIILMTAQAWSTKTVQGSLTSINEYLAKPIKPDALIRALLATLATDKQVTKSASEQTDVTKLSAKSKGNILVVEDNYINQQVIINMLKNLHYNYQLTSNGAEAIEAIEAISAHPDTFDLVLMDCQMPIMDGYEASLQIRKNENKGGQSQIPIVALTANAMSGDKERCLEVGMNDYLEKPVLVEALEQMIQKWIA